MAKNFLQNEIMAAVPHARSYGRALTGDTNFSDLALSYSASKLLKQTLPVRFFLPQKIILPALIAEFHHYLDSKNYTVGPVSVAEIPLSNNEAVELIHEKVDRALCTLSETQRRVFLLITLTHFDIQVTARILSLPGSQVKELFRQAHLLVADHLSSKPMQQAA